VAPEGAFTLAGILRHCPFASSYPAYARLIAVLPAATEAILHQGSQTVAYARLISLV
jgi:hypothetical protein